MKKNPVIIVVGCVVAIMGAFLLWKSLGTRATAARVEAEILKGLTAEQISLVLKSQALSDVSSVLVLTKDVEGRKSFLAAMREHLALAAEARREGLGDDANFKINLEYKRNLLLSDMYLAKLRSENSKYVIPREEIDGVWSNVENEKLFARDMSTLRKIQESVARERGDRIIPSQLQGESLMRARENWARAQVYSAKARNDQTFMSQPETGLRLRILEAGILSADYLRAHWSTGIKATRDEINSYLASHPEFDVKTKLENARTVLQRALKGEDFGALAKQFSEDRSSKDKGGLYENVERGTVWEAVENAVLALEPGQINASLIETETGYHIVKLVAKKNSKGSDGVEKVSFDLQHILLQKNFEEPGNRLPGVPPPFMRGEEIAKAEVERTKRNRFVEEIVNRNQISLPDDFVVQLPPSLEGEKK